MQEAGPSTEAARAAVDAGVAALALVLRLSGAAVDYEQLRLDAGRPDGAMSPGGLCDLARRRGCKAKLARFRSKSLRALPAPAILLGEDGAPLVLLRMENDKALLADPSTGATLERDEAWARDFWSGEALLIGARSSQRKDGEPARLSMGWFLPALGRHRALLGEILAASLFIQIFGLATPLFTLVVIDKVLTSGTLSTLDVLIVGLLAMAVFDGVMGVLRGHLLSHTTNRVDVELGARLFRHLTALPLGYFSHRPIGATLARVKELETVRAFLTGAGLTVIIDLAFTVVFLGVMYAFSPALTMIAVATVIALIALYAIIAPILRGRLQRKFADGADLDGFLVETVGGIETLKGLGLESVVQRQWEDRLTSSTDSAFAATGLSNATTQIAGFLNKLMAAGILWYGAHLVLQGQITAGTLIAFNMLAGRVSAPAMRLAQLWQQVQQARVGLSKLSDILETPTEPGALDARASLPAVAGRIAFRDVTFRYRPTQTAVLNGCSFEVAPGEAVGILAPSGSGKTTIVKLLQRLYAPEGGRITVDGLDLAGVDPGWLRRQIGVVPQDVFLFNRTVRENIALADPGLPLDRVVAAARLAGAHDFIAALPEAYDTIIGERGTQISGGERQRLALARALVTDPRILVLDEATSALDYDSERHIHASLRRIRRNRTVIIIAHRREALAQADRLLVLEEGRITRQGAPGDILAGRNDAGDAPVLEAAQ